MKVTKIKEELKSLSVEELTKKVETLRQGLFSLRLNASTAHVKDYSEFEKLKKNIARALTYLHEKQLQEKVPHGQE